MDNISQPICDECPDEDVCKSINIGKCNIALKYEDWLLSGKDEEISFDEYYKLYELLNGKYDADGE